MSKTLDDFVKAAFGEQMLTILGLQAQNAQLQEQIAKLQAEKQADKPPMELVKKV